MLSLSDRGRIENIKDRWSAQGKRVILLAQKSVPSAWTNQALNERVVLQLTTDSLTFVGLVALVDPPVRF